MEGFESGYAVSFPEASERPGYMSLFIRWRRYTLFVGFFFGEGGWCCFVIILKNICYPSEPSMDFLCRVATVDGNIWASVNNQIMP